MNTLQETCQRVRYMIINQGRQGQRIHYGSCLSCVEMMVCLYLKLKGDEEAFVLSKGHASLTMYILLTIKGIINGEELKKFKRIDGILEGHPVMNKAAGIDMTTGSLGQGLSIAVGMALERKFRQISNYTYCMIGDGECQSGQIWESAMAAANYSLDNLIVFLDNNRYQVDGPTETIMNINPIIDKWVSFGWYVQSIDGHDINAILNSVESAKNNSRKPSIIVANTIKGKGIREMENNKDFHSAQICQSEIQKLETFLLSRLK